MIDNLVPLARTTLEQGMKNRQWTLTNLSEITGISNEVLSNILRSQKTTQKDFEKINEAFKNNPPTTSRMRM